MRSPPVLLADPTWPYDVDELEEIMYQLTSFRARKFADTVSPCTTEASGPGRQNAAEWLRTAFHDMSTANTYFGTGGLDGSLQYELTNGENTGPGHETTLRFMGDYVTPRSSLADLIALGVYTSVRSCGGPDVPIRCGRKNASGKGATGVPQPQNSAVMFQQQFERMGFTQQEMIQLTACSHTLGGVHGAEFPELTPPGVKNGEAPSDSTVAVFDNRVVTEYLDGKTENPLVVGSSARLNKNSDFKVFNSDGNKAVEELRDPDRFRAVCKKMLQKMIDVVPPGVALSDPIAPYEVKPVGLQLTLERGGSALALRGYIRVRTTGLAKDAIKHVAVTYKDRRGSAACGASSCTLTSTVQGVGQGFDETFAFFPLDAAIPASSGISSFTVTVHYRNGMSKLYDNNGRAYPVQDAVVFQAPQSCVRVSTGALTVVAAVRNDEASKGAKATVWYRVPLLKSATVDLAKGECAGGYTLFSADYTVEGGLAYQSHVDVTAGGHTDGFRSVSDIGGTCAKFESPAACDGGSSPSPAYPTQAPQHIPAVGGYTLAPSTAASATAATPSTCRASPSRRRSAAYCAPAARWSFAARRTACRCTAGRTPPRRRRSPWLVGPRTRRRPRRHVLP